MSGRIVPKHPYQDTLQTGEANRRSRSGAWGSSSRVFAALGTHSPLQEAARPLQGAPYALFLLHLCNGYRRSDCRSALGHCCGDVTGAARPTVQSLYWRHSQPVTSSGLLVPSTCAQSNARRGLPPVSRLTANRNRVRISAYSLPVETYSQGN